MPQHAAWEPAFEVGHPVIDAQHQALLAACNRLADHVATASGAEPDAGRDQRFDQAFEQLKSLAREHFDAESSLLAQLGYPGLEDHEIACDEFDDLLDEIVTTEHFDRLELQRFLTLWWIGHIAGSVARMRAFLAGASPPG